MSDDGVVFDSYDAAATERTLALLLSSDRYSEARQYISRKLASAGAENSPALRAAALWNAQRGVLKNPGWREEIAAAIAENERPHTGHLCGPEQPAGDLQATLDELESQGLSRLPELLTRSEVDEAAAFFTGRQTIPCTDGSQTNDFRFSDIVRAPHLLRLALSPRILDIATRYLRAPPTLLDLTVRRTEPTWVAPSDYATFHRDFQDFRGCALYFYLSDVNDACGPHVYVKKSHAAATVIALLSGHPAAKKRFAQLFIADPPPPGVTEEIFAGDIEAVTGPAGTAFVEDQFGLHRVTMPTAGHRLMFRAGFGLTPYPKHMRAFASAGLGGKLPAGVPDTPLTRHVFRYALHG